MKKKHSQGEILLITHAAHERLPWCPTASWHLFYDEVPAIVWSAERNLIRNHRLLTDGITTEASGYPEYARVTARDGSYLRAIVHNAERDDVDAALAEIAARITSRHWHVYADTEQYANLIGKAGDGDRSKLILHGVLQPSLMQDYKSVTMVGADIGESALAHLWSQQGVRFLEDKSLDRYLRFTAHENGDLITIKYVSEISWSKRFRDSQHEGESILDLATRAILEDFGDEPFAFLANNDLDGRGLWGASASQAHRLPNTAHGVNSYQHLHKVALLSALNPLSAHYAFLDTLGMGSDEVRTAIMRSALYQAACRTSIRNPKDRTPKTIVAPDLETAVWLEGKFPGARVTNLLNKEVSIKRSSRGGRPRIHESEAVRKAENRRVELRDWTQELHELCKAEEIESGRSVITFAALLRTAEEESEQDSIQQDKVRVCGTNIPNNSRVVDSQSPAFGSISHSDQQPISPPLRGVDNRDLEPVRALTYASLYCDLYSTSSAAHIGAHCWEDFVSDLRNLWKVNTFGKEENVKFVPARMTDGGRCEVDAISSRMIVLDVDDGEMSPEVFANLFPSLRLLFVNSASNTPEAPRYRIFIPLDTPVPPTLYKVLVQRILKRLNRSGWWSKVQLTTNDRIKVRLCHGIDFAKLHAASLFNVPAQPDDPRGAMFEEALGPARKELDVMEWIARGNPRRREDLSGKAIVVTPRDREEAERLEAEIFENQWSEHMDDIEVPVGFKDTVLGAFRNLSTEQAFENFWSKIRTNARVRAAIRRTAIPANIQPLNAPPGA